MKWMCHLVKWRGQKIVKSREAWESLTFIRTPPLSPSLPFLAILANIFSDIHLCSLPAVNFLVTAIMTVCLGIGGEGGWRGVLQVNLSQESTALCSAVYSAWSSCKMNISLSFVAAIFASIHSGETCICIFFLVRCWMLSVCSGAPHSLNSRDQYL